MNQIEQIEQMLEDILTPFKQTVFKEKVYYKTFKIGDREITLCGVVVAGDMYIGHSVKNPKDKSNDDLGKRIAYGRAKSKSKLVSWSIRGLNEPEIHKALMKIMKRRIETNPNKYINLNLK